MYFNDASIASGTAGGSDAESTMSGRVCRDFVERVGFVKRTVGTYDHYILVKKEKDFDVRIIVLFRKDTEIVTLVTVCVQRGNSSRELTLKSNDGIFFEKDLNGMLGLLCVPDEIVIPSGDNDFLPAQDFVWF